MAAQKHTVGDQPTSPTTAEPSEREVLHRPFKWHTDAAERLPMPGRTALEFAGQVQDIAQGVHTVLSIIHVDTVNADCSIAGTGEPAPRMVSATDTGALERLCLTSLELLAHRADELIEGANLAAERLGARHG